MPIANLKAIIFDMDGTLFNSFSVSYDAIREGYELFWKEIGVDGPTPSWQEVKRLIGLPTHEFYPAALPEEHRDKWGILSRYVGRAERRRLAEGEGRTFDGVHEALAELQERGFVLGCLSNASRRYFDAVMDECNLRKYFRKLRHIGEFYNIQKSDVLREWSAEFGGSGHLLYVGDRRGDIEAAHDAGVRAVGVTWGYGVPEELAGAEAVIDSMTELPDLVGLPAQ